MRPRDLPNMAERREVLVHENIFKSLQSSEHKSWGMLLGTFKGKNHNIIGILNCKLIDIEKVHLSFRPKNGSRDASPSRSPNNEIDRALNTILSSIPRGLDVIGIYYFEEGLKDLLCEFATNILIPQLSLEVPSCTDSVFESFLVCKVEKDRELRTEILRNIGASSEDDEEKLDRIINFTDTSLHDLLGKHIYFRVKGCIPCQFILSDIINSMYNEQSRVFSKLKDNELIFRSRKNGNQIIKMHNFVANNVYEIFENQITNAANGSVLELDFLIGMASEIKKDIETFSPILMFSSSADEILSFNLFLDVLVLVDQSSTMRSFLHQVIEALCIQTKRVFLCMEELQDKFDACKVRAYHFRPLPIAHFVTVLYPVDKIDGSDVSEEDLLTQRRQMHEIFLLGMNEPFLKKVQDYFSNVAPGYLINPHIGLKTGINGGICAIARGKYAYHHYMQDRFDDNGWGCAYRSLQTICSWFQLQGYTPKSYPSHQKIQDALVAVGDKPKSFIGSKQWIGSFEVSICLQEILQVQSKILHVPSGAEMALRGRELIDHFQQQGTPVMIGGGVLAHTILGVHFNELTGEIKFLILDPHYTGNEDLKTVQDKGWCGWKGPNFWDQTAHYNMCLPQKPEVI